MRLGPLACVLAAAVGPLGCSCGSGGSVIDAGVDAGVDGGRDAGRDAGYDAGRDAGRDAGPADPGWTRLPSLPDGCNAEIAADPVAVLGMRTFRACPDTGPGCRELVVDWPAREGSAPAFRFRLGGGPGYDDGIHGYITMARPFDLDRNLVAILRDDGLPVMVVRAPSTSRGGCYIGGIALSDGHMLMQVNFRGSPDSPPSWLGHAPVSDRVTSMAYLTIVAYPFSFLQVIGVSSLQGALNSSGAYHVEHLSWDGTVTRVAVGLIDSPEWDLDAVVGSVIFYSGYGSRNAIYAARGTSPGEVFIDPVGAEASVMAADGRDMAWLQLYGRRDVITFDRVELWTSPYTDRASDLAPRMLAVVPLSGPKQVRVGWGAAVIIEDFQVLHLHDLTSSTHRTFRAAAARLTSDGALYVGRTEVAVSLRTEVASGDQVIRFIRRDAFE